MMSRRLSDFLLLLQADTYPEPCTEGHSQITAEMAGYIMNLLPFGSKILDVGCGQGPALALFRQRGFEAIGISTNEVDLGVCRERGFFVRNMDQNALDFPDEHFDLVWARHVLEHSIMPYWTLHEFKRVCKTGGLVYIEVPAPDTACHHETNQNHYSCLTYSTWFSLITRTGLKILEGGPIKLQTPVGPDEYWMFTCRKGDLL